MNNNEMYNQANGLEVAIIGMSGRFPGARNLNDFWENLKNGVVSIIRLKDEDIAEARSKFEVMKQPTWVQVRASMEDMEYFDSSFFGYTPKEAELMNPQMRIFHQCAWEALEDSGYEPRNYNKPIGLYTGATTSVQWEVGCEISGISRDTGSLGTQQLADKDYLATRIAYNFNLRGPVAIVQTACSTSLVAVHMACQAVLNGECYMALAGGISAFLGLKNGYVFTEGSILSRDGAVRAFDAKASGTVFGNGVGVVALKTLEDAIADRDHIYAVIKATAINNDGSDKAAFPAPSVEGQVRVVRMAQQLAEVDPRSISYIETHGTGTNIGDPIEIEALTKAFNVDERQYCAIGAVKSNVGHLDAAAGITGLIKTALALSHRQIPPSVNYETPNPKIDFENSPFFVNTQLREWKNNGYPLRAGVSAFGVGGTNAHMVLEQAPQPAISSESRKWQLLTISAKTKKSLEQNTERLVNHLMQHPGINLADAAYTLKVGRRVLEHRRMTVCSNIAEAAEAFTTPGSEKVKTYVAKEKHRSAIFMFSGQGSQYVNMGLDLYRTEPVFREEMDSCFKILRPILGYDIKEILYPSDAGSVGSSGSAAKLPDINQTEITQPVIFIIEYALARLLIKWGLKPFAMIGHSIGEYVAAALADVFSLEDALKLVCLRGQLMQKMPSGSMLSMPLPEEQVTSILKDHPQLEIAAVNSSAFCVVSGPHEAVDALMAQLKEKGTDCTRLHTSHAFHSRMLEPMLAEFEQHVRKVKLNKPVLPYISNVTGTWISVEDALDPTYWTRQIRGAVRFSDGVSELLNEANAVFIEVGPGKALATFVRQHQKKAPAHLIINMVRHPKDDMSDDKFLMEKVGELWLYGLPLDWNEFYARETRNRVSLPSYSFDTQHFWFKDDPFVLMGTEMRQLQSIVLGPQMPLLDMGKKDLSDWFYLPTWKLVGISAAQKAKAAEEAAGVLIFLGSDGLGQQLAKQLEQRGKPVTTVTIGSHFAAAGETAFEMDPRNRADYGALFAELKKQNRTPGIIVHLWNLPGNPGNTQAVLDLQEVEKSQDLGFYSLFYLAQAIGENGISSNIRVSTVSANMQEVTGGELLRPGQATVLGPVRVIPIEFPTIKCKSIDIVPPDPGSEQEKSLIPHLIEDFLLQSNEAVVAYRGNQRWVQIFEPLKIEKPSKPSPRLRKGGVYLITGGLGGLGLVIARDLAKNIQPKLILTGRSSFPDKAQWSLWVEEHGEADPLSKKIRELQRLEELGAEVMAASAEVSNLEQMKTVVQQAEETFGPINGVIHAAGVPDGGMLQLRKREDLEPILLPKIAGTLVLDQIFMNKPLDMLILFSSIIAVAPPFGQIGYSGANAFLDAFAHLRTARGSYTVSINWDGWQEVGMVVNMMKKMAGGGGVPAIPDLPQKDAPHPFFAYRMEKDANQGIFISYFRADNYWALDEHRILIGKPSLPGTGFLELIHAAFNIQTGVGQSEIRDLGFLRPLMIEEKGEQEVQTILKRKGTGNEFEFMVMSRPKGTQTDWQNHASGVVAAIDAENAAPVKHNIEEIRRQCREKEIIDVTQIKEVFNSPELFGPRWRCCQWIMRGSDQWLARLELPGDFSADIGSYPLHPALLDVAVGFPAFIPEVFKGETYLPFSYKRIKISKPLTDKVYCLARYSQHQIPTLTTEDTREVLVFDVTIMDDEGVELIEIEGYTFRKVAVPVQSMPPAPSMTAAASQEKMPAKAEIKEPVEPANQQVNIIPRSEAESFSVFIGKVGELESFGFMPFSRRSPRPEYGEIEFEVSYVGVNFKDVLFSLGILPLPSARYIKLGFECAGKVVRVAEGVEDYKVGDEVVALVAPCYMEHVTLPRDLTMKLPKGMTAAEAVTMPMAYITAYYCLIKKADLQPGERVLIHSAAGGVGMAAVKIAQWKGAEIFATAGTPEKRDYLRSLGIQHVMDSRSLEFADQVMEITNGEGVDVVLNSLAGDFIPKSISLLRQYGRFLELGVKDFYNDTKLGMRPFMNSLSYFAVTMTTEIPNIFSVWKEVVEHIYNGHFTPLPLRIFPLEKIGDAFKYMLQGVHTGRILLSFENKDKLVLQMPPEEEDTGADVGFNALYARDTVFSPHTVGRTVPGEKKTSTDAAKTSKPKAAPVPAAPSPAPSAPAPSAPPVSSVSRAGASANPLFNIDNGILPDQGVEAFNRILHETVPQLVVSTRDFRIPASQLGAFGAGGSGGMGGQMPFAGEGGGDAAPKARPEMLTEYVAPRDDLERQLVDIFKSLLGFEAGVMDDFFEMGGDSLKASGVINKVNHTFGITVPVSEMFVRKNISGLAEYIRGTQSEDSKLEQMLKEIEAMPSEKP